MIPEHWEMVEEWLLEGWSPEQTAGRSWQPGEEMAGREWIDQSRPLCRTIASVRLPGVEMDAIDGRHQPLGMLNFSVVTALPSFGLHPHAGSAVSMALRSGSENA